MRKNRQIATVGSLSRANFRCDGGQKVGIRVVSGLVQDDQARCFIDRRVSSEILLPPPTWHRPTPSAIMCCIIDCFVHVLWLILEVLESIVVLMSF